MDILRALIKEPPSYNEEMNHSHNAFPSLIDLALEAVHMGADEQAKRLLDLRDFLVKHFKEVDLVTYAEKESNEDAYRKYNPRVLG